MALSYYHSQPDYGVADAQLYKRHGIASGEPLPCPEACPPIWEPSLSMSEQVRILSTQEAFFTSHNKNMAKSNQDAYDRSQEIGRRASARTHNPDDPTSAQELGVTARNRYTSAPFPAAHLDHIVSLARRQKNLARPNIILSESASGCGRDLTPACLHGHLIHDRPQCPFLWAVRLQREGRETGHDVNLIKDTRSHMRGGQANHLHYHNGPRYPTKAALAVMLHPGRNDRPRYQMVPMTEDQWRQIFEVNRMPVPNSWHPGHG